jgi:hypothetical protein
MSIERRRNDAQRLERWSVNKDVEQPTKEGKNG